MPEPNAPQMSQEQVEIFNAINDMVATGDVDGFLALIDGLGELGVGFTATFRVWRDFLTNPRISTRLDGK